jgi:hypothetical protein
MKYHGETHLNNEYTLFKNEQECKTNCMTFNILSFFIHQKKKKKKVRRGNLTQLSLRPPPATSQGKGVFRLGPLRTQGQKRSFTLFFFFFAQLQSIQAPWPVSHLCDAFI